MLLDVLETRVKGAKAWRVSGARHEIRALRGLFF
jgi:hypothetical protein